MYEHFNIVYAAFGAGNIDYFNSQTKFESLYNRFTASSYIYNGTTDSWFKSLTDWLAVSTDPTVTALIDPTSEFCVIYVCQSFGLFFFLSSLMIHLCVGQTVICM
jgi:hypothetical protein